MNYTLKLILKNVSSFSLLSTTIGIVYNALAFKIFPGRIGPFILTGIVFGLFISLFAVLLDSWVALKRKQHTQDPYLIKIKNKLQLSEVNHGYCGQVNQIPIYIYWNFLPFNKKLSSGISLHLSFSPLNSEKLYEMKKEISLHGKMEWDAFMLKWFIPFKSIQTEGINKLIEQIIQITKIIQRYNPGNLSDQCIHCKSKNNVTLQIINDIPVYICDQCKKSI